MIGQRHLDHVVSAFVRYYHELRPHQSLDNRPPLPPQRVVTPEPESQEVVCREFLGGLLKHYERRAA